MKKYEFTGETKEVKRRTLHRIRLVRDLADDLLQGTLGGWIEEEANLSHEGLCWVTEKGMVYSGGLVQDDAIVHGRVFKYSQVGGKAVVGVNARVYNRSTIFGNVKLTGSARVRSCRVSDCARIEGDALVSNSLIKGHAIIGGKARVSSSRIEGNAYINEEANVRACEISNFVRLQGTAKVHNKGLYNSEYIRQEVAGGIIFISGHPWDITVYDGYAQVGCQLHTIKKWLSFSRTTKGLETVDKMARGAAEFYPKLRLLLRAVSKITELDSQ